MMKTCFCSHFWWLSTLLVLSSYSVISIEAGLLRSRVSSSSSSTTTTTINRSLAEQDDQEQEEGLFADSIPTHATPQEGATKTITIPCLYNLQFFEGSGLYAIPPEGPTPEELEGLLRATEKFYTHQMKIDPVFGNDFVSFQMLEDNHRLVLAGTVDPGPPPPPRQENNDNEQQPEQEQQEEQQAAATVVTNTTTLKLEVYAKVELVSSSQLTQEQTAMAMPAYDLTQLIRGYLWKADPRYYYANDDNAEDAATTAEAEHPQQKKNNNLFHQTHWLEIIATYSTVGEGFEELLTNDSN